MHGLFLFLFLTAVPSSASASSDQASLAQQDPDVRRHAPVCAGAVASDAQRQIDNYVWDYPTGRTFSGFHKPMLNAILGRLKQIGFVSGDDLFPDVLTGRSVLSLGEGESDFVQALLRLGMDAVAIEARPNLSYRRRASADPAHFRVETIQSSTLRREFDVVYSSYALNFIFYEIFHRIDEPTARLAATVRLIEQVLRFVQPGGIAISFPRLYLGSAQERDQLLRLLNDRGWRIEALLEEHFRCPTECDPDPRQTASVLRVLRKPRVEGAGGSNAASRL